MHMRELTMYTTIWCGYCRRLKLQLDEAGIRYREVDIEEDAEAADFVSSVNDGDRTVPTVVLPDGSAKTNPTFDELRDAMAA
jgi:mycoredoxin